MSERGGRPRARDSFLGFAEDDVVDADAPDQHPTAGDASNDGAEGGARSTVGDRSRERRTGFVRRHKAVSLLLAALGVIVALVLGSAVYLNEQINHIPRIDLHLGANRPAAPSGAYAKSMNILLAGADNGDAGGETIADTVKRGNWTPGVHRSDTIMVLHLTADRKHAYLISVPRDTYTDIEGYGDHKINAAFSYGGPSLFVRTIEQFTGLRMQHLAIIDWNGFRDLSTALGGVRVYIDKDTHEGGTTTWRKGYTTLEGNEALNYVRTRHGLENGDYDRIKRQQNFMRAALSQAADKGSLTNPIRFKNLLTAITGNLTVDSGFSNSDIRTLAWSLRQMRPDDITFITAPMKRFESNSSGSVTIPDVSRTRELFGAVATDDLGEYVTKYGDSGVLGAPDGVS